MHPNQISNGTDKIYQSPVIGLLKLQDMAEQDIFDFVGKLKAWDDAIKTARGDDVYESSSLLRDLVRQAHAHKDRPYYFTLANSICFYADHLFKTFSQPDMRKDWSKRFISGLFSHFTDSDLEQFFIIIHQHQKTAALVNEEIKNRDITGKITTDAMQHFRVLYEDGRLPSQIALTYSSYINQSGTIEPQEQEKLHKINAESFLNATETQIFRSKIDKIPRRMVSHAILDRDDKEIPASKLETRTKSEKNATKPISNERSVNEELPQLRYLLAALANNGIKITEIITGPPPKGSKKGHYFILKTDKPDLSFALANGHQDFVIRNTDIQKFLAQGSTVDDLINDPLVYQTCAFERPETWAKSAIHYSITPTTTLGTQSKHRTFWSGKKDDLLAAFKRATEATKNDKLPNRYDEIVSDDPDINGKKWGNVSSALTRGNIEGLEHVHNLTELFFELCATDPSCRNHMSPNWWTERKMQREKQFLERRPKVA